MPGSRQNRATIVRESAHLGRRFFITDRSMIGHSCSSLVSRFQAIRPWLFFSALVVLSCRRLSAPAEKIDAAALLANNALPGALPAASATAPVPLPFPTPPDVAAAPSDATRTSSGLAMKV